MELKTCEYCGTAYDARLRQCPLCGRTAEGPAAPAEPERTSPVPEKSAQSAPAERPAPGRRLRQDAGAPKAARGYAGKRLRTASAPQPSDAQSAPGEAVYAIPKWMMTVLSVIVGAAVLGGALLAFSRLGWSPLYREPALEAPVQAAEPAQPEPEQATVQQPAEPAQPDENRYMNEEDQKHDQTPEPEQNESSVSCTSLTLSAPTVTFEEAGRFFNITFTRTPADCTEPVAFSSSDETVATVSEQGKIIAVNAGSAVITAQCGEQTAQCLVTCDFAYVGTGAAEGDPAELALNKDDLTFMNAGEQYTLSVTGAPDGAKITWQSSDESIVTVSENGVLTAKGKGTATVKAAVDDSELTCIVRCNFEDRSGEGECTISNSDVTMGVKGETFQISLRDANGDKITGLLWVSSDVSVCSVDGTGVVKAEDGSTVYTMGTVDSEKVAAWLDASASPGEYGNAIFNGHVSWKKVAGVFSVLPKMEEGEEIIVEYDDGSTMTFTVTNVDIYGIDDVPETVMAYDTGDSRMTLITCYGESWNSGLGTRNQRCVVVAKPVDSSKIITPPAVTPNPDEDCDT